MTISLVGSQVAATTGTNLLTTPLSSHLHNGSFEHAPLRLMSSTAALMIRPQSQSWIFGLRCSGTKYTYESLYARTWCFLWPIHDWHKGPIKKSNTQVQLGQAIFSIYIHVKMDYVACFILGKTTRQCEQKPTTNCLNTLQQSRPIHNVCH